MKLKIFIFIAGVIVALMGMALYSYITHPYTRIIDYQSKEKSQRFMDFLEINNVLYSHTYDHLKRHWVKPHIKNETEFNTIKIQFEKQEELNLGN